jgi:trehalose/maltose transport system substrate-binding protein
VKRRLLFVPASLAAILCVSSVFWAGGQVASARQSHASAAASTPPAPKDPWASQDKKFKGQTITYLGGSVGTDHLTDVALAKAFTKSTGIHIKLQPAPSASDQTLSLLQRVFGSGSSSIDATRLDVVWPGTFANYLVNLRNTPAKVLIKLEYPSLIQNDTVGGKLVAMPYQGDFGMLYYRTDLLSKYGYSSPPTTWDQLTTMAKKIQTGEQKSNKNFWGFVFQGNSYEGLTCDALEWIASYGGGSFITPKGQVTVNNAKAKAALKLAQSWVGSISPKGVTAYQETDVANSFTGGNAAFARNWPYMDSAAILGGTKVQGKVGVAPLPHGPGGASSATTGGWQIGVSKFSKHLGAAEAWARYYASKQVQIWRGAYGGIVPTDPSVNNNPKVKKAQPYLTTVGNHTKRVVRPSTVLKGNYNKGSTFIFQAVNSILTGSNVDSTVSTLASELQSLHP